MRSKMNDTTNLRVLFKNFAKFQSIANVNVMEMNFCILACNPQDSLVNPLVRIIVIVQRNYLKTLLKEIHNSMAPNVTGTAGYQNGFAIIALWFQFFCCLEITKPVNLHQK
jgi:hypothetical protein